MGYEYVSFSNQVKEYVGHDFSFLESEQFPADVKIRRVDYDPAPFIALRIVLESASYTKTMEEALASHGLTITCYSRRLLTENGKAVQFTDYNPIPENFYPEGIVEFNGLKFPKILYAKLPTHRSIKVGQNDHSNAGRNESDSSVSYADR